MNIYKDSNSHKLLVFISFLKKFNKNRLFSAIIVMFPLNADIVENVGLLQQCMHILYRQLVLQSNIDLVNIMTRRSSILLSGNWRSYSRTASEVLSLHGKIVHENNNVSL